MATFYITKYEQRSREWLDLRVGRLGTSQFYKKEILTDEQQKLLQDNEDVKRGVFLEPYVRIKYAKDRNVEVREIGMAIPYWDERLCASTDGLVGDDGIIEIKCPRHMYQNLLPINNDDKNYLSGNVMKSHMWQMQGCMRILERKWCDYVVYSDDLLVVKRIPYMNDMWEKEIYPNILKYFESNNFIPKIKLHEILNEK